MVGFRIPPFYAGSYESKQYINIKIQYFYSFINKNIYIILGRLNNYKHFNTKNNTNISFQVFNSVIYEKWVSCECSDFCVVSCTYILQMKIYITNMHRMIDLIVQVTIYKVHVLVFDVFRKFIKEMHTLLATFHQLGCGC